MIHYIFVRKDLPLGVLAAMITHAAGTSASFTAIYEDMPLSDRTTAVVLEADNEAHLHKIEEHLRRVGLTDYSEIYESSGPYAGQYMAIGMWPAGREYFGEHLSHYRLLRSCVDNTPTSEVSSQIIHDTNKKGDTPS